MEETKLCEMLHLYGSVLSPSRYRRVSAARYLPVSWNLHQCAWDIPMLIKEKHQEPSWYKILLALNKCSPSEQPVMYHYFYIFTFQISFL